jgi:hypothetical protein
MRRPPAFALPLLLVLNGLMSLALAHHAADLWRAARTWELREAASLHAATDTERAGSPRPRDPAKHSRKP